jgi:hypothetical protein
MKHANENVLGDTAIQEQGDIRSNADALLITAANFRRIQLANESRLTPPELKQALAPMRRLIQLQRCDVEADGAKVILTKKGLELGL